MLRNLEGGGKTKAKKNNYYFKMPNFGLTPDEDIPRSPVRMDFHSFTTLTKLTKESPWLESLTLELIELWNLCETQSEQGLVCDLLKRLVFVDSDKFKASCQKVSEHILSAWNLSPENTIMVATVRSHETDGSQPMIHAMKSFFTRYPGWTEENFYSRLGDACSKIKSGWTLVVVDDFIGTGEKISKLISWIKTRFESAGVERYQIKICAIAAMNQSRTKLDLLEVDYFAHIWLKKGIRDHFQGQELESAIQDMLNIESQLAPTYHGKKLPSFGYGESEALFYINPYNAPNNVFPVFWWPGLKSGIQRYTIFNRF